MKSPKPGLFALSYALTGLFLCSTLTFLLLPCFYTPFSPLPEPSHINLYSRIKLDNLNSLYAHSFAKQDPKSLSIFSLTSKPLLVLLDNQLKKNKLTLLIDKRACRSISAYPEVKKKAHISKGSGLMHCKLLTCENGLCLIGSANLTPSSLEKDHNLVVALKDKALCEFIQQSQINPSQHSFYNPHYSLEMTPKNPQALISLIEKIQQAKSSIKIAMFTFTHPSIAQALAIKAKQGVVVEIILEGKQLYLFEKSIASIFKDTPVKLRYMKQAECLHHKFAWIDEKLLISGSCNWTKAAFEKNRDCLLFLNLPQNIQQDMKKIWHRLKLISQSKSSC